MATYADELQTARDTVLAYISGGKWTRRSVRVKGTVFEFATLEEAVNALRSLDTMAKQAASDEDSDPRVYPTTNPAWGM